MAQREEKLKLTLPPNHGFRIAIVQSQFNSDITNAECLEAQRCAAEYGVSTVVFTVTGSFELPQVIDQLVVSKHYDGFVAIGCLIKGETIHFELLAHSVAEGLMTVALTHHVPVGFGVITALTSAQAQERTSIGYDATYAVLQTLTHTQRA